MPAKNQMTTGVVQDVTGSRVTLSDGRSWLATVASPSEFVGRRVMVMVKGNRIVTMEDVAS